MNKLRLPITDRLRSLINTPSISGLRIAALLFSLVILPLQEGRAATNVWTGSSTSGTFKAWSDPLNWVDLVAPSSGDDLWFLSGPASAAATNDLIGFTFRTIRIEGADYTLLGNALNLTGNPTSTAETFRVGLTSSGTPSVVNFHPPITLTGTTPLVRFYNDSITRLHGTLNVSNRPVRFDVGTNGVLVLTNRVSGTALISKIGDGPLILTASNTFTGGFSIEGGSVIISNNHALGTIAGTTVISNGGTLVLAPGADALREQLILLSGSTVTRKDNFWTPSILSPPFVTATPVAPAKLSQASDGAFLYISNSINGFGSLDISGNGNYYLRGTFTNLISGTMRILNGASVYFDKPAGIPALSGPLIVGDNLPLLESLYLEANEQIPNNTVVTVNETGIIHVRLETIAGLAGSGTVSIISPGALIVGFNDTPFEFGGQFFGDGPLDKIDGGTGILSGNSPNFTGDTTIYEGTLDIRGNHRRSTVSVLPGARLTGNGTNANLFVQIGGIYQPGRSKQDGLNTMTSSNLNLNAGAIFRVAIWGDAANRYGRAIVKGSVNLTNAVLDIQLLAPIPVGSELTIIDNDGADPVNGTFVGLPGGTFTGPNGLKWEIEYGNDVILRLISQGIATLPPSLEGDAFLDILVQGGNGDAFLDPNECAQLYIPIYNEESFTNTSISATLVSAHPGLVVHQPYSAYPALPPGTGAYNLTPFQISVPTNFVCGTNLAAHLVIKKGTNAPYALPLSLPTGKPVITPIRVDSSGPADIVDDTLNIFFVDGPAITGHLAKIEVSMHLAHANLTDVSVTLVGPGGVTIPLVLNQPGASYGTACADTNRTTFRREAPTHITAATPPYVGVFRPVGILPLVRGMHQSLVDDRWYLHVEDTAAGNAGTNFCWSLFFYPAQCGDGGGVCKPCPEPIIDSVGLMEVPGTGRLGNLDPEFSPTACGDALAMGYFTVPGDYYYKLYTFKNQSDTDTCVSVQLETLCTGSDGIISSAHLGGYNPALPWTNVLGFIGNVPGPTIAVRSYSFIAPANADITIVVSAIQPYTTCGGFTLYVNSPDLCPAELAIRPAPGSKVRLDWSTGAAGYLLQKNTNLMAPTNWHYVPDTPVVSGDRFVVTNTPIDPAAFFRLLKP